MMRQMASLIFIALLSLGSFSHAAGKQAPFLITGKLPHLTGLVKLFWDDEDLKLSPKQKERLLKVRQSTLSQIGTIKKLLKPLENSIAKKVMSGTTPQSVTSLLQKVSELKIQASVVHFQCIYDTKKILTKEQLDLLL